MTDIVVDTNVFVQSGNAGSQYFENSRAFCSALLDGEVILCLDEGSSLDETDNQGIIGHEYLVHIRGVQFAYNVLVALLQSQRFKFCSTHVDERSRRAIYRLVHNPRDRTFLRVTLNSDTRLLVSHDFEDYPEGVRRSLLRGFLGIRVQTAEEAIGGL